MRELAALALCLLASCVQSNATRCGDLTCPSGRACAPNGTCVDTAVVSACVGKADGAGCELADVGVGTCQQDLCLIGACGDGVINAIDACDGAELAGKTCLDFGSTDSAGLACASDCSYDTRGCSAFCGDGTKNTLEECDKTDFDGVSCTDQGFYGGTLACTDDCKLNLGSCRGQCGDNTVNGFEPCDGADLGGTTCEMRGFLGDVAPLACGAECAFTAGSCSCGDVHCVPTTERCVINGGIPSCQAAT